MNGAKAQAIALACHGNAFLRGIDTSKFFPGNRTVVFCEYVRFAELEKADSGEPHEKEVARTPPAWFDLIKSAGVTGIRVLQNAHKDPRISSDPMAAAYANRAETWYMELLCPKMMSDLWVARWHVGNREAPDQRIWQVRYVRLARCASSKLSVDDVQKVSALLAQALREVHSFSAKHGRDFFTQCFAEAIDVLASGGDMDYAPERRLAPAGYLSPRAETLLQACQKASVFGGMGWWNDTSFEDPDQQAEFQRVSNQLYHCLEEASAVAANEGLNRIRG